MWEEEEVKATFIWHNNSTQLCNSIRSISKILMAMQGAEVCCGAPRRGRQVCGHVRGVEWRLGPILGKGRHELLCSAPTCGASLLLQTGTQQQQQQRVLLVCHICLASVCLSHVRQHASLHPSPSPPSLFVLLPYPQVGTPFFLFF